MFLHPIPHWLGHAAHPACCKVPICGCCSMGSASGTNRKGQEKKGRTDILTGLQTLIHLASMYRYIIYIYIYIYNTSMNIYMPHIFLVVVVVLWWWWWWSLSSSSSSSSCSWHVYVYIYILYTCMGLSEDKVPPCPMVVNHHVPLKSSIGFIWGVLPAKSESSSQWYPKCLCITLVDLVAEINGTYC